MTNNFYLKTFLSGILIPAILLFVSGNLFAQISHPFHLNYGGTELKGSVDIFIKIVDKAKDSRNKIIEFPDEKIKADVSKFKKPTLVVEFSNLKFQAPRDLISKLSLDISSQSPPKGFAQNRGQPTGPIKIKEERVYNFEIVAADTILAGDLKFYFNAVQIGKRNFKLKDKTFQLFLNINPPPLFPPDATENELWKIASRLNTVKAFDVYMQRFPEGKSIQKAQRQKKDLIANPPIKYLPNNVTEIRTDQTQRNENQVWKNVQKSNKIETYNNYLIEFPKGKFAAEAKSKVISLSDSLNVKVLRSAEDELKGRLIYYIEDTMTIGHTYRVRLEISSDTSSHFIEKLITTVEEYSDNPQDFSTEIIEVGKTMHAHLEDSSPEDDKNFYIHLFGESSERKVDLYSSQPTIWEWDVRPLKKGYHPLYFTIEIITKKDGIESPKILPVYDSKITILAQSIFQTYKIQFIAGGVICLLLIVILSLIFKKKKAVNQEKDLDELIKTNPLAGATALIENDKIEEALNVLNQFLDNKDNELLQEVILLKSRLSRNESDLNKATISKEAATNERNSIKLSTLDIINRAKAIV